MTKILTTVISTLLVSNIVWAHPVNHMYNTSLYSAIHENVQAHSEPNTTGTVATATSHDSQKYNSLFHGALAIQGVKTNIVINANSKIDYARHKDTHEQNNSLFRGALAK